MRRPTLSKASSCATTVRAATRSRTPCPTCSSKTTRCEASDSRLVMYFHVIFRSRANQNSIETLSLAPRVVCSCWCSAEAMHTLPRTRAMRMAPSLSDTGRSCQGVRASGAQASRASIAHSLSCSHVTGSVRLVSLTHKNKLPFQFFAIAYCTLPTLFFMHFNGKPTFLNAYPMI